MNSPSMSGRVGMATGTNHNDYVTRAMARIASTTRRDTIDPDRISHQGYTPVIPEFGSQHPPNMSRRVGMASEMNHNDYATRAMARIANPTRSDTTELGRIRREVHGLDTPGLVSQRPPGMSSQADMIAEPNHSWRMNAIADMERTQRRNSVELARILHRVRGLDTLSIVSQNYSSDSPARDSGDLRPETLRSHSYRQFVEVSMNQMREGIRTHQANMLNEMNDDASEAPTNRAETFLESLPLLSLADLPGDSQDCPICMEQYYTSQHTEPPVRLPCHHVIGKDCLLRWLKSSVLNRNNSSCPMCRTVLFKRDLVAIGNQLRGIDGIVDQVPEPARWRVQNELARLDGVMNRLRSDEEQSETLARSRDTTRPRLEQLNGSDPAPRETSSHDTLARLQAISRVQREELAQLEAARRERGAIRQDRMRPRADLEIGDTEIVARRDHVGPLRERRGAFWGVMREEGLR